MGYELHITRTPDWLQSAERPISREKWEAVARNHPVLREDGVIHWADIGSQPIFSITGNDGRVASLTWQDAHVYVSGYYGDHVQQTILALAEELGAMLVGDEGERYLTDAYELDTGELLPLQPQQAGRQAPRPKGRRWWRRRNTNP